MFSWLLLFLACGPAYHYEEFIQTNGALIASDGRSGVEGVDILALNYTVSFEGTDGQGYSTILRTEFGLGNLVTNAGLFSSATAVSLEHEETRVYCSDYCAKRDSDTNECTVWKEDCWDEQVDVEDTVGRITNVSTSAEYLFGDSTIVTQGVQLTSSLVSAEYSVNENLNKPTKVTGIYETLTYMQEVKFYSILEANGSGSQYARSAQSSQKIKKVNAYNSVFPKGSVVREKITEDNVNSLSSELKSEILKGRYALKKLKGENGVSFHLDESYLK